MTCFFFLDVYYKGFQIPIAIYLNVLAYWIWRWTMNQKVMGSSHAKKSFCSILFVRQGLNIAQNFKNFMLLHKSETVI